jgi:hypothetical protein
MRCNIRKHGNGGTREERLQKNRAGAHKPRPFSYTLLVVDRRNDGGATATATASRCNGNARCDG